MYFVSRGEQGGKSERKCLLLLLCVIGSEHLRHESVSLLGQLGKK